MSACFCTGLCRKLGYCPVHGAPFGETREEVDRLLKRIPQPVGWLCPRCGVSNSPDFSTCRNPDCKPSKPLRKRVKHG